MVRLLIIVNNYLYVHDSPSLTYEQCASINLLSLSTLKSIDN